MMLPGFLRLVGAKIVAHSPELLTGTGLFLGGGCVITACKATLKADEKLKDQAAKRDEIELKLTGEIETEEPYTEELAKIDRKALRRETAKELVKDYALPVGLGMGSVACILSGHHILAKRFGTVATALTATTGAFAEYRRRVAEEYGEDVDQKIMQGKDEVRDIVDGTEVITPGCKELYSVYSVIFDEKNPNWNPDSRVNLVYLNRVQSYLTDKLRADGYLFWADVLDYMKFPKRGRPAAAYVVGWYYDPSDPTRDNLVDLGHNTNNDVSNGELGVRQLLMGGIRLDPNVDGPILDKLPKLGHKRVIDDRQL